MQNLYSDRPIKNILSIDVEEWYQAILFNRNDYRDVEVTNLPQNISQILFFLDKYNIKATFFIVGLIAKKYPEVIKAIAAEGHEISSHGYLHKLVYKLSRKEFIEDVALSLDTFKKYFNIETLGYRAPTWSINKDTPWALESLKSLGLKYDSSLIHFSANPLISRGLERFPYEVGDGFFEVPPSTFRLFGYNLPFAGGTFLRFFSGNFIVSKIKQINKQGYPAMVYFHSWEFGDYITEPSVLKWKYSIQFCNLSSIREKLSLLFTNFEFCPIRDTLRLKYYA
ncbi:MAG: polysaccharide deacetylase family protein [Candidatus Omnitrophota bacterium]|nr:polysaccharide deacetylase family protein [Candidatus Omnitrophota bacterium]